jgi:hypothetical protein
MASSPAGSISCSGNVGGSWRMKPISKACNVPALRSHLLWSPVQINRHDRQNSPTPFDKSGKSAEVV